MTHPIGIIGGGLGGLAAACTLAARGYAVTLFDKNAWLGGKAAILNVPSAAGNFRFDMGPTILLMPSVLRRIFGEARVRLEDYLTLVKLDPEWRCFFADGSRLDLVDSTSRMADHLRAFSKDPALPTAYAQFMRQSEQLASVSDRYFFWRSVGGLRDMMEPGNSFNLATLKDVLSLRMWSTMAATVRATIKDPRVAQMVDHFTQYVGSSPEASPAVLAGIGHMQTGEGIWYPMGGTGAIPQALTRLAIDLGVKIHPRTQIARILTDGRRATGVVTESGEQILLSAVVSNCDSVRTYRELLGGTLQKQFDRRRSYEPACSGVVLYLGLKKRYDHIAHHDFVFSRDPHEEFHAIYKKGEPAPDPTCYLCSPSATDPETAPAGGDALYVLVHTPYLRPHHDWSAMLPAYRRVILDKLKKHAGMEDIESRIVVERALTPADIESRYHTWKGAIYGLASHGRLNGAFKPGNRSPDLPNLYLAGGAAHPGPGMPMVLMSGWIAADSLDADKVVEPMNDVAAAEPEPQPLAVGGSRRL
jgi:phytoene desaturase